MKRMSTVTIMGLLCFMAFSMLSPNVHASVMVMPTRLPPGIGGAASVWDGTDAYIFGVGSNGTGQFNQILKYNPSTGSLSLVSASFPDPIGDFPAVWAGRYAYVFGGYVGPLHTSDKIIRYDPSTDTTTVMGAKLPTYAFPLYSMAAIWNGNYAYLFGGYDGYSYYDQILKYDPTSDQITVMGARLPTGTKWMPAVWSGTYAYIFGGRTPSGTSDQIVRYDPAHDSVTVMSARLPLGIFISSAVWDGPYAYIFGGSDINNQAQDSILRYDPSSDSIAGVESLPTPRRWTCAIWDGSSAYVFGGEDSNRNALDEIVKYSPEEPALTVSISPLSASVLLGQSVSFTSTVDRGKSPYGYQWYIDGSSVLPATLNSWTYTPSNTGVHYVYLKVTDADNNTAQSETARVMITSALVGGYSVSLDKHTRVEPLAFNSALVMGLALFLVAFKRKAARRRD